uniref:Microbial-type PARG catalytic domain-containing protein n=1 Tax=Noctiluca scintillans TaxID=2966 RepID=A0A7S1AG90_NOCSC
MGLNMSMDGDPGEKEHVVPELVAQMELLRPVSHRLLRRFLVRRYGVLGVGDQDLKVRSMSTVSPGDPIGAVIVDSAEPREIRQNLEPTKDTGVSLEIFCWLQRRGVLEGRFPAEVREQFTAATDVDAERRAKYHCYGRGQHVIHAVGPVLEELDQSIRDLTETYAAILSEFCVSMGESDSATPSSRNSGARNHTLDASAAAALAAEVTDQASRAGRAPVGKPSVSRAPNILRFGPVSCDGLVKNKALAPFTGKIFFSALAIALERLPWFLQDRLKNATIEVCIFRAADVEKYENALTEKREVVADAMQLDSSRGRIAQRSDGFEWVRTQNGVMDRFERLAITSTSMRAIFSRSYSLTGGQMVQLNHIGDMIDGTLIRTDGRPISSSGARFETKVTFSNSTAMDLAVKFATEGTATVAVNAASAYQGGGGVLTGGRHALEEAWCVTSTVLKSLQEIIFQQLGTGGGIGAEVPGERRRYLPENGVVVSPMVEVFREGYMQGYAFLPKAVLLKGVVSLAMYNRNPRMKDSPVDAPRDPEEYRVGVRRKFRAMVAGAIELGAEVLVCPPIGCGVFDNNPTLVGSIFGEVLRDPDVDGRIREVVISGNTTFCEAAQKAMGLMPDTSSRGQIIPPIPPVPVRPQPQRNPVQTKRIPSNPSKGF